MKFSFCGALVFCWIQTTGAACGRLKGRMTAAGCVGLTKGEWLWGTESRETSWNWNARFLCRRCVCVNCFSDSFGFSVQDFLTIS